MQIRHFADVVLDVRAVIGHRAIDVGTAAQQVAQLAAQAIAHCTSLAVAPGQARQVFDGILHVAHAELVVEVVVEIERLLSILGIAIGQFHARLLTPEQVRHQAHKARLGELLRVLAHGVIDAPDFHDGDDAARRRAIGHGEMGTHHTIAQRHLDVACLDAHLSAP